MDSLLPPANIESDVSGNNLTQPLAIAVYTHVQYMYICNYMYAEEGDEPLTLFGTCGYRIIALRLLLALGATSWNLVWCFFLW